MLYLMRLCVHAIMANSSYGCWAAWLGSDTNDDIVIVLKNWWDQCPRTTRDISFQVDG